MVCESKNQLFSLFFLFGKKKNNTQFGDKISTVLYHDLYLRPTFQQFLAIVKKLTKNKELVLKVGLSFYQFFTILPVKNFYQFTSKFEW